MARKSASSARAVPAGRKERRTAQPIDFSDIPEVAPAQLRQMRRVGRPPIGDHTRKLIAIRLDPAVLRKLRKEANRRNVGYQTLVNRVLADYVRTHAVS